MNRCEGLRHDQVAILDEDPAAFVGNPFIVKLGTMDRRDRAANPGFQVDESRPLTFGRAVGMEHRGHTSAPASNQTFQIHQHIA